MKRIGPHLLAIFLIFASGSLLLAFIDQTFSKQVAETRAQEAQASASDVAVSIGSFTEVRFTALTAITSHFLADPSLSQKEFEIFAMNILSDIPEIRSIQWVDSDWHVRWVVPLEGNKEAVGHDLRASPKAAPFVAKAINERRMTVNNPYVLRQGGLGVIARAPIFQPDGRFEGLAVAVLDVPAILKRAVSPSLLEKYHLRLRDANSEVFWIGEAGSTFGNGAITRTVKIGDNRWLLDLHPKKAADDASGLFRVGLWGAGFLGLFGLALWIRTTGERASALEDRVIDRTRRLTSLNSVADALTRSLQPEFGFEAVIKEAVSALDMDQGAVLGCDRRGRTVHIIADNGASELRELLEELKYGSGPIGAVAASGSPLAIGNITAIHGLPPNNIRSLLVWPLRSPQHYVVGLLILAGSAPRDFSNYEARLLDTIAAQIGIALENRRFLKNQNDIASALQKGLLPGALPECPGFEIGTVYESATPEAAVGGDFYDIVRLPDGALLLAIGDVSGKGVEAATTTALIRYTVRVLALDGLPLEALMERLNSIVAQQGIRKGGFVTTFLGRLDPETGILQYASAGHPSPGVLKASGQFVFCVGGAHLPLGISTGTRYQCSEIDIDRGDTIIMYTDGVIEARRGQSLYGEEQLATAVSRLGNIPASDLAHGVYQDCREYSGNALADDLAIVTVKRL